MSISWNEFNDSSDMSAASSDEGPSRKNQDSKQAPPPTALQKTISSPEQQRKDYKFDDNQKIGQNLQKLAKHTGPTVWLYVTDNYSNRGEDSLKILKDVRDFEDVSSMGKGFNVQLRTQAAANYMEKGYYEKGINFKFSYSNKNLPKGPKNIQKKYSSKDNEHQQAKTPKIKTRQTYNEKPAYREQEDRDRGDKGDKKRVKYVAKDSVNKKIQQEVKPLEEIQERSESNKDTERTVSKEESKQEASKEVAENKKQTPGKIDEPEAEKSNPKAETKKQQEKKSGMTKKQSELSDDEKSQDKEVKQKKKKDRKKKKGKNGGGQKPGFDPNNPFSSLM